MVQLYVGVCIHVCLQMYEYCQLAKDMAANIELTIMWDLALKNMTAIINTAKAG